MVSIRRDNRGTPAEICAQRFSTTLWGYEKHAVDTFVLRVAADLQLLLDATSELAALTEQDASEIREHAREAAQDLLRSAEELAKAMRREARRESTRICADASAEAHAMKNWANQIALEVLDNSETAGHEARKLCNETLELAHYEIAELRSKAIEESVAILKASRERARVLISEAEQHAQELLNEAESEHRAQIDRVQQLLTAIGANERRVAARLSKMEPPLQSLALMAEERHSICESEEAAAGPGGGREPVSDNALL